MKSAVNIFIFFIIMTFCFSANASESIKIAGIFAKTGIASKENKFSVESVKIAVAELNKQGGVLGKKIELVILDNKSTPIGSKLAAQKAVKLGVSAVIGANWSSHSLPIADVLQKAEIPMITPSSSSPKVTRVGDYIFRVCFNDNFQGKALAEFAYKHLGVKNAVVLKNIDEEYSLTLGEVFKNFFIKSGGKVLWEGGYRGNAVDFSNILSKVKNYKPDLIFVPGYERDGGLLIKQAVKTGINSIFLGADAWDSGLLYTYAGKALEGSYRSAHWHPDMSYMYEKLKNIYEKKLGSVSKINSQVALTYDAVMLLADAISRAGSADREKIRKALADTHNFKGVTGIINFNKYGAPIDRNVVMLKFENGNWVFIKSVSPEKIKIASIFSHTGAAAKHNKPSIDGVRFAINEVNRQGGIFGVNVKLIEIDNKSTPIGSQLAAKKAVQDDAVAIIGAAWSSHSIEVAKIAQENKIPMITNISTYPNVTKVGDYIFRACFTDAFQGQVLAEFAKNYLKADSAAIFTDLTSRYSMGLADEFEKKFNELGGKTFFQLHYRTGQEEFTQLAIIAKNLNPGIIFIPGHDESGLIVKKLLENNNDAIIVGGDGWNDENFFRNGGSQLQKGYYCTHWTEAIKTQISNDFVKRYKQHGTVSDKSALAYDAVMILKNAIEHAGSIEKNKIREALSKTKNFQGVTGTISFNKEGDPIKDAVIMQIIDGKSEYLKTVTQ